MLEVITEAEKKAEGKRAINGLFCAAQAPGAELSSSALWVVTEPMAMQAMRDRLNYSLNIYGEPPKFHVVMTAIQAQKGVRGDGDYFWESFKVHHPRHGPPTINDEAYEFGTVEVKGMSIYLEHEPDFEEGQDRGASRFCASIYNFEDKIIAYLKAEKINEKNCAMREEYETQLAADSAIQEPAYTPIPPHVDLMHVQLRSPESTRFFEMRMANFIIHVGEKQTDGLTYQTSKTGITYTGLESENLGVLIEEAATEIEEQMSDFGWVYTGLLSHEDLRGGVKQFLVPADSPVVKVYKEENLSRTATIYACDAFGTRTHSIGQVKHTGPSMTLKDLRKEISGNNFDGLRAGFKFMYRDAPVSYKQEDFSAEDALLMVVSRWHG